MLKLLCSSLAALAALPLIGVERLTPWASVDPKNGSGIEIISRVSYTADNFADGRPTKQDDWIVINCSGATLPASAIRREKNAVRFAGPVTITKEKRPFNCEGKVEINSPAEILYSVNLKSDTEQNVKESYISLRLGQPLLGRKIRFEYDDGGKREFTISPERGAGWLWTSPDARKISSFTIPAMQGFFRFTVPGNRVMINKWHKDVGNIVVYFADGARKEIDCSMKIEFLPYKNVKLDLRKAFNMGFADETADDRKGGWTDQGPNNDLRTFKPGADQRYGNVVFDTVNPAGNQGKSVLAMSGPDRMYLAKFAEVPVNGAQFDYLNLLHTGAYCLGDTAGCVDVLYQDGTKDSFEVRNRRDVANWWGGIENFPNATIVWRGQTPGALVSLFLTRFKVQNKPIEKIAFRSSGGLVWLIVAATGTAGDIPFPVGNNMETPLVIKEGRSWRPYEFSYDRIPGGPLDFSWMLDAPAGKYGRTIIRNGHFEFEKRPGQKVRFHGISINNDMALLQSKELVDRLLNRVSAIGYNMIRLHRFDEMMTKKGVSKLPQILPEELDHFFYLIAKAKERGMYITMDIFGERISGFPYPYTSSHDGKFDVLFRKDARDNMKDFARQILCTVNPYTGLTLKDDPVLTMLTLVNEGTLVHTDPTLFLPNPDPRRQAVAEPVYKAWCRRNGLSEEMPDKSKFLRFAVDVQHEFYADMKNYLRGIGVNVPLADTNNRNHLPMALVREPYDFVDNHFYYDHPTFRKGQFSWPQLYHNRSIIKDAFIPLLEEQAATRQFGKPFVITEFNFCHPNQYMAEGGAVTGAIAAIQDWDEIVRLGPYYQRKYGWDSGHLGPFSTFFSPITSLSELMLHMFWVRGDVKPAAKRIILTIPSDFWKDPVSTMFMEWATRAKSFAPHAAVRYALSAQIGTNVAAPGAKPGKDEYPIALFRNGNEPQELKAPADGRYSSEDGQVFADTKTGVMKVMTPKSEAVVIPKAGVNVEGKALKVTNSNTNCTVFAGATDNVPFTESKRILLLHLSRIHGRNQKISAMGESLVIYNYGTFRPYLAYRAKADIELKAGDGEFTVNALDAAGKIIFSKQLKAVNGVIKFHAAVDAGPEKTAIFAYEILRNGTDVQKKN